MSSAFEAVRSGRLSVSSAAKEYNVPRMTLSDRVNGKIPLNAKMGVKTALTTDEESALCSYISYMANRGFPLSIQQLMGFAWCIAKERGREHVFTKSGPSRKWWQGFKKRHPDLSLRRPDALDRGRACLGNVNALREYFQLLKETIEVNGLSDKPERIYNCDEAALFLNKSAGQKVIVPTRTKHPHSLSVATNEHISVHCCVSAAGQALPPMIIFSKSMPGGAYHRNGPVNASYACSDSGFMDQSLYQQWFEKTFLGHVVPQRPLLLIQDGASSHVSVELIRSAIANDVILLCLPPKTTHITQPLDVAVYRKMKIETAKIVNQAKMVKSDLWISKKQVSSVFKVIFEKSFTMDCITEGFRKCGIHPFDPNAVDKSLLLRSNTEVDPSHIDLAAKPEQVQDPTVHQSQSQDESIGVPDSVDPPIVDPADPIDTSFSCLETSALSQPDDMILDISFSVGEDGILALQSPEPEPNGDPIFSQDNGTQECPPELALSAVELTLTPRKKRKYKECYNFNIDLPDQTYKAWCHLKNQLPALAADESNADEILTAVKIPIDELPKQKSPPVSDHPLVKAGLIPNDLVNVLVVPTTSDKCTKKETGKARVLTSADVQRELEEKELKKKLSMEQKEQRKQERERKRIQREIETKKKKEEIMLRKEMREKQRAEKLRLKEERIKQRELKRSLKAGNGSN